MTTPRPAPWWPARRRAEARLGQRLSAAEVRAGKATRSDYHRIVGGGFKARDGWAEQCRCRHWFIARVTWSWRAYRHPVFGGVPAGARITRRHQCRVCEAAKRTVRRRRSAATRRAQRAATRAGLTCQACGHPLAAERRTRRFCNATCRQAAHRHAKRRRGDVAPTSVSVTGGGDPLGLAGVLRMHGLTREDVAQMSDVALTRLKYLGPKRLAALRMPTPGR